MARLNRSGWIPVFQFSNSKCTWGLFILDRSYMILELCGKRIKFLQVIKFEKCSFF